MSVDAQSLVSDGMIFPESLRWRDGALWFVDMYDGRLYRHVPDAETACLLDHHGYLGGIGWDQNGEVRIASKLDRTVIDQTGQVIASVDRAHSPLNDFIAHPRGSMFFGEYGFDLLGGERYAPGKLWLIQPDGSVICAAKELAFPNGMGWSADGRTLYVVECCGDLREPCKRIHADAGLALG